MPVTTDGTVDIDPGKLVLARLRTGLSQRGVMRKAKALGLKLDHANYARYERGLRRPYPLTLVAICQTLEVDVADLMRDAA